MTADPKAAEREAAAREWIKANEDSNDPTEALVALLATRERDAAVGALRDALAECRTVGLVHFWSGGREGCTCNGHSMLRILGAMRLALEQGTPAMCASCGKPLEGERFTIQASVRADLVGKTVGRCCWPPDHASSVTVLGEWTPATREETP